MAGVRYCRGGLYLRFALGLAAGIGVLIVLLYAAAWVSGGYRCGG